MYQLYNNPFSQHSRRVVALMEEAGLDYEPRHVALDAGEHMSTAFLGINPNHQVPVLVDGDLTLWESNAILRYLCHKHALWNWYPQEARARARVEQWLDWNQCRLSPGVIDIVLNKMFLGEAGDAAAIERGEARIAELAPILEAALSDQPFIAGAMPTIADISIASNVTQLALADAVPDHPALRRWHDRVCALDGVRKSNAALAPEAAMTA